MAYNKQEWRDNDPATPLSATRLGHIESGIEQASANASFVRTELEDGRLSPDRLSDQIVQEAEVATLPLIEEAGAGPQRLDPMPGQVLAVAKGVIGLGGKIPVSIRHDDWHNHINTLDIPAGLHSRALPWGLACISRQDTQAWFTSADTSWTTVRAWVMGGMEIWSHGTDHTSPYDADPDVWLENMREQIVTSKAELEAQNVRVMGLMMPGVPAPGYGSFLTNVANWNSDAGRLLQATYGLVETDMHGFYRELPSTARYGLAHFTISDGQYNTLAAVQKIVTEAIETGRGVELMIHAGNLGTAGKMPVAVYWQVMDWLKTLRDAGTIEVVTPSSLPFCDPRATHRPDLVADNDFTSTATGAAAENVWQNIDGVDNARVTVNDGPAGRMTGALRINTPSGPPILTEPANLATSQRNGAVLMTQFKARRVGASGTVRIENRSIEPYDVWAVAEEHALTDEWQTIRFLWTSHINTNRIRTSISSTTGVIEVTDMHVYLA